MFTFRHPEYEDAVSDWTLMRDAYRGERRVKSKATLYLPMTNGHVEDGGLNSVESKGYQAYLAYKLRARFPNFTREAVGMAVGMMHSQPPKIDLPPRMEKIMSSRGENLTQLLRRINTEQLIAGRIGIMVDLPTNGGELPYLATYFAERIINWDDGEFEELVPQRLNLVIMDETEHVRKNGFRWELQPQFRILTLGSAEQNGPTGVYRQGIFEDENSYSEEKLRAPTFRGQNLEEIPFVFVNSCDLVPDVDDPPLLDLANMCMTIYRTDADYRQNLFLQGQDTFVTSGGNFDETENVRVGAGARIDLPMGGKAEYVGVKSDGLSEQREALDNLERRAGSMGAQTLDTTSRERESGDSLRIRVSARTADLNQVADTGAAGLEESLKIAARWMGENPDQVKVTPNKDFGEAELTGQNMVDIAAARNQGWPISARTMHDLSRKRRLTDRTFEEEMAEAEKEKDTIFKPAETGDRAPDQLNEGNNGT